MQVLGDLIKLPDNHYLPLPWWHRAPVGLQSKTWCYIAIVESKTRPVPELIISVLNPSNWDKMIRVRCTHPDELGAVSKAITEVKDYNIALAESSTLQAGELHEITLMCEPKGENDKLPTKEELKKKLKEAGFSNISILSYEKQSTVLWVRRGEVNAGWIKNVDWYSEIQSRYQQGIGIDKIDLSKAIISADTDRRLLRFIFPYKDAKTIQVEHLDQPGVLQTLTNVFFKLDFNVLSQLLRRGGARPGNAILLGL